MLYSYQTLLNVSFQILNLGLNKLGAESIQPLNAALNATPEVEVLM